MIFRSKHRKAEFSNNIKINGTDIDSLKSTICIYIDSIDSKLNWSKHINFIKGKIAKAICIICKARKNLNIDKIILYLYLNVALILYPVVYRTCSRAYCIEVWGRTSNVYLLPLFRLHQKHNSYNIIL